MDTLMKKNTELQEATRPGGHACEARPAAPAIHYRSQSAELIDFSHSAHTQRRQVLPNVKWFLNELLATEMRRDRRERHLCPCPNSGSNTGFLTPTAVNNKKTPEGRGRAGNEGAWPPSVDDREPGRCLSIPHRLGSKRGRSRRV